MDKLLCYMLIFFGGGFGCLFRYLIDGVGVEAFTISNISACCLMGICYALFNYRMWVDNKFFHCFITIGFLGGLSTFTPLAVYSLVTTQDNILMAILALLGILLAYSAMCAASYYVCALILKYGFHKKRQLSLLARSRYLAQFKVLLPRFNMIKELGDYLIDLEIPLYDTNALGKHVTKRNELQTMSMNYIKDLYTLTEVYNQSVLLDGCDPHGYDALIKDARKKGDIPEDVLSLNEQLEYIDNLSKRMTRNFGAKGKRK